MKIRITLELEYDPSELATSCHDNLADQWLSDMDLAWMKDEGQLTKAEATVIES